MCTSVKDSLEGDLDIQFPLCKEKLIAAEKGLMWAGLTLEGFLVGNDTEDK